MWTPKSVVFSRRPCAMRSVSSGYYTITYYNIICYTILYSTLLHYTIMFLIQPTSLYYSVSSGTKEL